MKVSNAVHQAHDWVLNTIARDFELLDVWELPVRGAREDFRSFLDTMAAFDPIKSVSGATRVLFRVRRRMGELLGWDDDVSGRPIPGHSETSLAARLPEELRDTANGPVIAGGFVPLYRTDEEFAAELSNATVHGVLQLVWVERRSGRYQARLAVYVKPRGRLGAIYLKLIGPFRHLIVYPALTRQIGRAWAARTAPEA